MKVSQKIKAINPFTNPKKLKKLALTTIILLVIICLCQTFLLINLSKPKPTSFLRFADYQLGASIVKFDKSLKYSVPLEAALLSKTFTHKSTTEKRSRRKEFFEENKNIQDYLDDEENILASSIADKTNKAESFIILHFDLPRMLYVSARTEDGENIPIVKKDKWKLLDTSQFYAKPNEVTTIYLTADDKFYTYEYMFRLKIRFI